MFVVTMSTRTAAAAYLFFLLVSLANTAVLNRSYVERSAEKMNDDANMYTDIELIEDYPMKPVTIFDILKRVLAQKPAPPEPTELIKTPFRKRTCYFNAGMSHSCDYKELLQSADDANHWSSEHTPGKRRKRSSRRGRAPAARSADEQQRPAPTL
ncbi:uncharacterized protein LOC124312182 [Daphnia pulicaria]|uniref:uncharacterized protein LOC124312182 n=1 Tax=Daphnia pulicaria TaxID=35523 RepID=UPI001EE9D837|nr:uncharacterized protein LOC124312182 [Daphnia pulicaria]